MDRTASLKKLPRRKQGPIALEQRVVFDADVPVAIDPIIDVASQDSSAQESAAANASNNTENVTNAEASNDATIITSENKNAEEKQTGTQNADERELIPGTLAQTNLTAKEIIFIDAIVSDIEQYLSEHENADVVLLDQNSDALAQIAAVLNGRTGIEAVHIISHGNTGELQAGNSVINLAALQSGIYNDALATIKSALSEDADILIYGCNVAQGEAGKAFVQALADATGADIAASTDDTGASTLGGDWDLESNTGAIDTDVLSADEWLHNLVQTTINPTGGTNTAGTDGLRIYVTNLGQIQVFYKNAWQFYNQNVTDTSTNLFNGFYMAVGTQVIGPDTGAEGMTKVAWRSSGAQTLTGTGTAADPWVVTTTMYYDANNNAAYNAANDTQVVIRTSYTNGTAYFTQNVTVTPPATNTSTIKVYHALDTFLGGQDNGTATSTAVGGNTSAIGAVGTGAGAGTSIYLAEAQNSTQFNNTYSDVYNGAGLYGTGISGGGDLDNNFNTANNDIGIGAQWTLGAINTPTSFSYHIAFAGAVALDLDANNSTATGNNYAGVYVEGTSGTNVVDTDRAINNIIGDLNQVTVVVSNAQAGDVLNVTGLPAGITVTGNGTTSLTLSGAATEADYQTALSLVQFSTTSTNTTTRAINIQARNQINELSAVATANIGIDLRPTITLDTNNSSGGANDGGWQTTYTENGVAVRIADTDADINDRSQNDLLSLSMTVTGNSNGVAEIMNIGGVDIALNANNTQTVTVGGTTFAVNYVASTGVFSVTRSGGGVIPQADLDSLVQNITYRNTSENPTAGNRTVSITVSDARSTSTAAVSTINVVAVNDAAVIAGTTTGAIVEASGIANAVAGTPSATGSLTSTDVDGVNNSFTAVSAATASVNGYGTYTMTAAGTWAYTVDNNNAAVQALNVGNTLTDTFTVTAADGTAQVITITINGRNDTAVIAGTATANLTESNVAQSTSGTLSVTDVDNSNTFTAQSSVAGSNGYGVFSINAAGAWTYAMNTAQNAFAQGTTYTDSITVAAADGTTQVITVSILGTNDAPTVANPITAQSVNEDSALNFTVPATTFSEVDNGDSLTLSATLADGSALPAWLSFNAATGTFSGTPANGDVGSLNIRVTATDSLGASVSNTFALTVNNTNDAPIANTDSNTGLEEAVISGNVLSNDTDVDLGDTQAITTFTISGMAGTFNAGDTVNIPSVGSFNLSNTGAYTFTPVANYNGTVPVITYTMRDTAGVTATATLGLTVTAVNDAPTVSNTNASGTEDAPINGSVSGNDVDGNPLTYSLLGVAPAGVVFNADGTFSVTPIAADQALDTGESRVVTFQYIANDGAVNSAPATITVTINGVNDAPTVANTNLSGTEDAPISGSVAGNDVDVEVLTYSLVGAAPAGVVFNADGTFTVTPIAADQALNVGDSRTVTFQYRANDGDVNSTPATVTVVINGVNDAPVSNPDAQTVPINGSVSGNVLSNDTDVDNPVLTVQGFTIAGQPGPFVLGTPYTIPGVGEFTINTNGGYTFTPVPNFNGSIPGISFVVTDGPSTDTGTLSLTMGSNTPPVAVDDSQAVTEDTPVSGNLLSNDTDINGNVLSVSAATIDTNGDGNADALSLGTLTTITNAANVTIGTITVNTNGSYTFNPASNYNGPVPTLTYTVNDGLGGTDTGSLTLGPVTAVNDAPTVSNTNASGTEDAPINGSVSGNDVDGNPLTYSLLGVAPAGVVFNADGTFSVTPIAADQALDTGESRVVTFQYIANDGAVNSAPATITVTINGVNDAPTVANTNLSGTEDAPISGSVAGNDVDVEVLTYSLVGAAPAGVVFNADGTFTVTPIAADQALNVGDSRTVTFQYRANDGDVNSTPATVTVVINGVNDAPVSNPDAQTVPINGSVSGNVLSNDTDVDNPVLTVQGFTIAGQPGPFVLGTPYTIPGVGEFTINTNGGYTFTPVPNFNGSIPGISFVVTDGPSTDTGTLSLTMGSNTPPVAVDDSQAVTEDTPVSGNLLSNDTDINGNVLSVSAATIDTNGDGNADALSLGTLTTITNAANVTIGTITVNTNGSYTFNPASNYNGPVPTLTYTVNDGLGGTDTGSLTLGPVTAVNDAPTVSNTNASGTEDAPINGSVSGNDVDGNPLTYSLLGVAPAGVVFNADGTFSVTPIAADQALDTGESRVVTFQYIANDGAVNSAPATITVTINGVNDAPTVANTNLSGTEDAPISGSVAGNDVDVEVLTYSLVGAAPAGVVFNADGTFTVTPIAADQALNVGDSRTVTFQYRANDGDVNSTPATVTVVINGVNDAPVSNPDAQTVPINGSVSGNVLSNDTDVDNPVLTVQGFTIAGQPGPFVLGTPYTIPGVGEFTINTNGGYTFTPVPNFNGSIPGISFVVTDGPSTDTGTLSLTMGSNTPPVAVDDSQAVTEDTPVSGNLLSNDTDINGNVLSVSAATIDTNGDGNADALSLGTLTTITNAANVTIGTITVNTNGSYTFNPASNYNGPVPTLTYTVNDGLGGTDTGSLTLGPVTAVNDAPTVSNTNASGTEDAPINGSVSGNDVDGNPLTYSLLGVAPAGVVFNADGTFSVTPIAADQALDTGESRVVTFQYIANDGAVNSAPATITVTINGVNDAPTVANTNLSGTEDAPISGSVAGNDVDVEVLTYSLVGAAPAGVVFNADGTFTVTPIAADQALNVGDSRTVTFQYRANDGDVNSTPATVTVVINGVNDAPVSNPDAQTVPINGSVSGNVLSNDTDVDNPVLTVQGFTIAGQPGPFVLGTPYTIPGVGEFTINTNGGYTFTPVPNFNGSIPGISFVVTDGPSTDTGTLSLTMGSNTPPVAVDDSQAVTEDTPVSGNLLSNDTDINGNVLSVSAATIDTNGDGNADALSLGTLTTITNAANVTIGTITVNTNGSYTFNPASNYNGPVPTLTYTVNDGLGGTDTGSLTLGPVTAVNDAPTVSNTNASGTEDAPINGSVSGNDVDGNPLTYSLLGVAPAGVVFNADGTFSVTPIAADQALDTGESRVVTFQYIANDGAVNSAPATITVTINGVNDAPTVANTNLSGTEDAPISGSVAGNDVDVEVLTYSLVGAAPAGVVFNADGTFTVTPIAADQALNVGDSRTVTFQYRANDGDVNSTPATVTVVINGVNDAPVSNPDAQTVPINGSVSGNVLSNDTDVDNPVLTVQGFTIAGQPGPFVLGTPYTIPGVGEFTINTNGGYTFTPVPNFNGSIPGISFVVTDGPSTDTGTLSLTMGSNTPPVAVDDSQAVTEDTPVSGNLLSNDTDINGNVLSVSAATIDTNGDGNADALSLGTLTTITNAANVTIGTITVNTNGSYTFNPASNYNGPVPTLTYTVNDGLGGTDTGSLTLGPVTAVNDAPTVSNTNASGTEDAPINGSVSGNDVDGNPLTYSLLGVAPAGVVFNADGTFSVTPIAADQALDTGESRVVTFQYIANDGAVNSAPATITVTINGVNDAPVATDNNYSTLEDSASIVLNPLVGDSDPDGTTPNLQSINGVTITNGTAQSIAVTGGTINISATGSISFTPASNFNGTITVPYVITDGQLTASANQYIQVIAVNDAPTANADSQTGIEDAPITGNVLSNDSDVDLDALTVTQFSVSGVSGVFAAGQTVNIPSVGNLVLNVNGSYTFNPNANFTGAVPVVSYNVTDGFTSTTSTLSLTVSAVNDAPIANDVSVTTPEDVNISISLSATDLDGTVTSYTITTLPLASAGQLQLFNGTPVVAGQALTPVQVSSLVFVPANNFNGIINIPFTATDNQGATSSPANIVIDVGFNNDAPAANPSTLAANEDNDITGITLTGSDVDGTISGVTITSLPSPTMGVLYLADGNTAVVAGTVLTPAEASNMVFKPAANFNGSVSIPFTVTDNLGAISSAANLSLSLLAVNDTPVAIPNSINTLEDTAITISLTANDVDNNLQSIRITALPSVSEGSLYLADGVTLVNVNDTLSLTAAANLRFVPAPDYNGTTQVSLCRCRSTQCCFCASHLYH